MKKDNFTQGIENLERVVKRGDEVEIVRTLEPLYHLDFHGNRDQQHEWWDRLFDMLLTLLRSPNAQIAYSANHYLFVCLGNEYGPPWTNRREGSARCLENFANRVKQLLPAANDYIAGKDDLFLRFVDSLIHVEGLNECEGQPSVRDWLKTIESVRSVSPEAIEVAGIVYDIARKPWKDAKPDLMALLDHPSILPRAYAARTIGEFYCNSDDLNPTLKDMTGYITKIEIKRPGVAGPFFGQFYHDDLEGFEERAHIKVEDWMCEILEQRNGPEPNTLPCSNNIDFFAHEIFGGRPEYIEKIIAMGQTELAAAAATEVNERIEGLQPLLVRLADSGDAEVCRQASWHLAYHYHYLHPRGEALRFVRAITDLPEIDLYLNLDRNDSRFPYAAIFYPKEGKRLDQPTAVKWLEKILPAGLGEEPILNTASDQKKLNVFMVASRPAPYEPTPGALVDFKGDKEHQLWEQVTIIWHGKEKTWDPESYLRG